MSADTVAGYRVHVGNPDATFLLLDVYDVTTPAEALEQARKVRYRIVRESDGAWYLVPSDTSNCTTQVEEYDCPDAWWEDEDNDLSTLEFYCDEQDAL